ncbi:MAG: VCBS repeat-containing protein, partial [Bacteroidetes bacterium]
MWNDQKSEILTNVKANQALKIEQKNAKNNGNILQEKIQNPVFQEVTQKNGIDFVHQENNFIDFNREPLMPYLLSTQSPKIAKADVNGDGLEDFFVGSARDQAGKMFVQNKNGQFESKNQSIFEADKIFEDAGVLFFDADNDKDLDLYVVSAGN